MTSKINSEIKVYRLEGYKINYPRASLIIYSRSHDEIWNYGDCQCIVNGKHYLYKKKIDTLLADARPLSIQSQLLNGSTEDELMRDDLGRRYILPFLKQQQTFVNLNH